MLSAPTWSCRKPRVKASASVMWNVRPYIATLPPTVKSRGS